MTVALITHPACLRHDPGEWHPECPDRLRRVLGALDDAAFAPLLRREAPEATRAQLARVHPAPMIDAILDAVVEDGGHLHIDADTAMSPGSAQAALRAAGGAVLGVDAVMQGWASQAFVAVRPPGHHAERARPMGFCLFANAAVAARHARLHWGLDRVAVLDFDVHHGNGTQDVAFDDPTLFYGSSHQHPCYPGTGAPEETGVAGNVVNVPLRPGTGSVGFRAAWENTLLPALDAFAPQMLIVSAGFDAHKADPLAQLRLETADFGWITRKLLEIARQRCGGRLVSVLEGGYDLDALAQSAALHVNTLLHG